jgi:hypothetical protein
VYQLKEEAEKVHKVMYDITSYRNDAEYVLNVILLWEQLRENKQNQEVFEAINGWSDSIQKRYQEKHSKANPLSKFLTDSKSFVRLIFELELLNFENESYEIMAKKIESIMVGSNHEIFDIIRIAKIVKWQTIRDYIKDLHSEKRTDYHEGGAIEKYNDLKMNALNYFKKK